MIGLFLVIPVLLFVIYLLIAGLRCPKCKNRHFTLEDSSKDLYRCADCNTVFPGKKTS